MKTKAALNTLVGLAVATTFFAGSLASAQIKTSVVTKKRPTAAASSSLKARVEPIAPAKSPFSLTLVGTAMSFKTTTSNHLETDITGSYAMNDNVSLNLDTGYESYFIAQEKNNAYDLEPSITLANIELGAAKLATTLLVILPTSRSAQEANQAIGYGGKAEFSGSIGTLGLDLDNEYRTWGYKEAVGVATPAEGDDLTNDKIYTNLSSDAMSILGLALPVSKVVTAKTGFRYRVKTPFMGPEKDLFRIQPKVSFGITGSLSLTAGVQWQKDFNDKTSEDLMADTNRMFFLQGVLSI